MQRHAHTDLGRISPLCGFVLPATEVLVIRANSARQMCQPQRINSTPPLVLLSNPPRRCPSSPRSNIAPTQNCLRLELNLSKCTYADYVDLSANSLPSLLRCIYEWRGAEGTLGFSSRGRIEIPEKIFLSVRFSSWNWTYRSDDFSSNNEFRNRNAERRGISIIF